MSPLGKSRANSAHFLNRELSWLKFDQRVLEEAENPDNPLLERLKFLAIFESNLDEFYMVRVSGLIEQYESGLTEPSADGLTAAEQLSLIAAETSSLRKRASLLWNKELLPALERESIRIRGYGELDERAKSKLMNFFAQEVFPVCTPLIIHPAPSLPFISNRSLNLAVELVDATGMEKLARIKVPDVLPRLVQTGTGRHDYVLLEDVIRHNLQEVFSGVQIKSVSTFRVIRDADIEIRELEAGDLIESIEQTIHLRRFGDPVLLEYDSHMPPEVLGTLMRLLKLEESDTLPVDGLLGLGLLMEIAGIESSFLKFPPHQPFLAEALGTSAGLFQILKSDDVLVHHPFDSFKPVEEFVGSVVSDPKVIGIKQTLYRVGAESPIVESLLDGAAAGKQVAVTVELKARFDESNNLGWSRALERAGAHVTFGFPEMKTHGKLCLIVRREKGGIQTYAHIGTGNYNPNTARHYTDLGLFTRDAELIQDILDLFNFLTGFSKKASYRKLLVAPINLREEVIKRIDREIECHKVSGGGLIQFKLNALVDPAIIDALYRASSEGVRVDLIVRGVCCLRPGVSGLSENIRVISAVGRFLEHSRILCFANDGKPEAFIGSADLMPRNLDRRIEVLAPVESLFAVKYLREEVIPAYWQDNSNVWDMESDGTYVRRQCKDAERFNAQEFLMNHPATARFA